MTQAIGPTYAELKSLSDEEVIGRYNQNGPSRLVAADFYLNELGRRQQARTNYVLAVLTAVNALAAIAAVAVSIVALTK